MGDPTSLWSIAPQLGAAGALLLAFVYVLRTNYTDRTQNTERVAALQQRHDAELQARDARIERQETIIRELRGELDQERQLRRGAEEREHEVRMGRGNR